MKRNTFKTVESHDGKRRVVFFRREDGKYSYREDGYFQSSAGGHWGPLWIETPVCDTEAAVLQEAQKSVAWLGGGA